MNNFNDFLNSIKFDDYENTVSFLRDRLDYLSKDDEFGLKAIHWACLLNRKQILEWLLKKKCDIETHGKNGWRAIHFAALMGHKEIIKFLIENYCETDCKTDNNETPLDVANGKSDRRFIDEIFSKTPFLKIGLNMGLQCGPSCEHAFCLTTMFCNTYMFCKKELLRIGKGTYGKIYKIGDIPNNNTFACKNIKMAKFSEAELKYNILPTINQYLSYLKINHRNIVAYHGSLEIPDRMLLIMEHMHQGSIEDIINSSKPLSEEKILKYTKDVLHGLGFLHKNNIIHRRIKPSHMLINERDECKLSISSFSRLLVYEDIEEEFILKDFLPGTLNFFAPEIINGETYNLPVDIWSLGCSIINMLTGFPPYYMSNQYELCFQIGTIKKIEFDIDLSISPELKSLIDRILNSNIKKRLTAEKSLAHSVFQRVPVIDNIDQGNNMISDNKSNSDIDIESYKMLIKCAVDNKEIGKSMGFKCENDCTHKLCLSSITATNFKKETFIGKGGCASVYRTTESNSNREYAIKCFNYDTNETRYFENKINEYKDLIKHDRIIKYYGAIQNIKYLYIFMEYMEDGSLTNKIKASETFLSEETIKKYSRQILEGVAYLHSENIFHRDIKSDNILINKNGDIKIADFGFCRLFDSETIFEMKTKCGTECYMSPEMIRGDIYDSKTDIWSVGATVLEMASGLTPYSNSTKKSLFKNKFTSKKEYPSHLSKEIKQFLDLMLQINPKKRASATDLLESNFLNPKIRKKSMKRFFCVFKK